MTSTIAQIASSDAPALITTIVLALIGCVLWLAGRRILRGSIALVGLATGAVLGLALSAAFDLGAPGWATATAAGLIGAILAFVAYRAVLAGALAAILGLALPLCVWTVLDVQQYLDDRSNPDAPRLATENDAANAPADASTTGQPSGSRDSREDPDGDRGQHFDVSWIFEGLERLGKDPALYGQPSPRQGDAPELLGGDLPRDVRSDAANVVADELTRAGRSRLGDGAEGIGIDRERFDRSMTEAADFLSHFRAEFARVWDRTPPNVQKSLMASAALGVILGILIGLAAPGISAAAVTAAGGSVLWMTMLVGLLGQIGVSLQGWVPNRPLQWIAIWTFATVIGLAIQWTIERRRTDKLPKRVAR